MFVNSRKFPDLRKNAFEAAAFFQYFQISEKTAFKTATFFQYFQISEKSAFKAAAFFQYFQISEKTAFKTAAFFQYFHISEKSAFEAAAFFQYFHISEKSAFKAAAFFQYSSSSFLCAKDWKFILARCPGRKICRLRGHFYIRKKPARRAGSCYVFLLSGFFLSGFLYELVFAPGAGYSYSSLSTRHPYPLGAGRTAEYFKHFIIIYFAPSSSFRR